MAAKPELGLINDQMDLDGFSRRYSLFDIMAHEPNKYYLTLGVKAFKAFYGISDTSKPYFDSENLLWEYGGNNIKAYGQGNAFLVNYYGPPSGYKNRDQRNKYKDHRYYKDAVNFCENWDQASFDPNFKCMTLDDFAPMVKRIFSRKPFSLL